MFKRLALIFIICIFTKGYSQPDTIHWRSGVFGQQDSTIFGAGSFLMLSASAGAMGAGSIASQGMMDATDAADFTATTGLIDHSQAAATHLNWGFGLKKEFFGLVLPFANVGTFGIYSQLLTGGANPEIYTINSDSTGTSILEYSVGASYARSFMRRRLSIGTAASYVESHCGSTYGTAFSFNTDMLIMPVQWMSSRLYVRNLGTGISGFPGGDQKLPLQFGGSVAFSPFQSMSQSKDFPRPLTLESGVQQTVGRSLTVGIGMDLRLGFLSLRTGKEFNPDGSNAGGGTSAGIGLHGKSLSLNSAWKVASRQIGSVWVASLSYDFENSIKRTGSHYLALARTYYACGRYKDCMRLALNTALADPNRYEAHSLLRNAQSALLRNNKLEISILYSGNIQGRFLPRSEGDGLGGLGRLAAVIEQKRRLYPVCFSIAAGNMITGDSTETAATAASHVYYHLIHNDVTCLGNTEYLYGYRRFLGASSTKLSILCIDGTDIDLEQVTPGKIVRHGGYSVAVISIVNINPPIHGQRPGVYDSVSAYMKRRDVRQSHLRIAVIHDTWGSILENQGSLQDVDVVVCGSIDERFAQPKRIGRPVAVSTGIGGMVLGNLVVRFDRNRNFISFDNQLIPLDNTIRPDKEVTAFMSDLPKSSPQPPLLRYTRQEINKALNVGVFPFLSDRRDSTELFLKMVGRNAEFTLGRRAGKAGYPAISFVAAKIAFSREDSATGCRPLEVISINGLHTSTPVESLNVQETAFSPDGAWLYYTAARCGDTKTDIFRIRPEGGISFPVVTWKNAVESSVTFSPDSKMMAFSSDRDGSWQVYLTDPAGESAGARPLRLANDSWNYEMPAFSPDGKYLAYVSNRAGNRKDLWLYEFKTCKQRIVTHKADVNSYSWFDDSKFIVFSSGSPRPRLMMTAIDTAVQWSLFPDTCAEIRAAEVAPQMIRFDGKRKIVYVRIFDDGERQTWWSDANGRNNRCLIQSAGKDWLGGDDQ
ncbi:MAG: hypothetical protein MUF22_04035 [Chitinispirillaceae bacterium]|jgi:hypothetical protein|nr:hypothetical protein [Chitinispirillaceae bacterium]